MVKKVKYTINYLIKADIAFVNSEDTYDLEKKAMLIVNSILDIHT